MPKRILIADDSGSVRSVLRSFLEKAPNIEVCAEASDGLQTLEEAEKCKPDLVVLDLSMPIMTGVEAAVILKSVVPRMKIILFSMHMDDVPKSLAAAVGVDLTLSKSDGISKLGEHLHELLT